MKFANIFNNKKNTESIPPSGVSRRFVAFEVLFVVFIVIAIFTPTHIVHAQWSIFSSGIEGLLDNLFKLIASLLMSISSLVLVLGGWLFDMVINFTIVDMAKNLNDPAGVGGSITEAWATLRDIANMCFIFVLLYAAFKTMFDSNFSNFNKTIRDIIIVALLINFSLFFSKVVIDASNIVALGFYNSISTESVTLPAPIGEIKGISPGYMNMLGIKSLYGSKVLDEMEGPVDIMIFGIMSSVFMLITAVLFLMVGIMFAARFIILIFLMILSPLALIAFIIPGQKKHFEDWREALINQSFFAPLYFALTWVVFKLGTTLVKVPAGTELSQLTTAPEKGAMAMIVNFVLIIGFSIAALIFSKQMASKGAAGTAFKSISGGIGTAAIGGSAWAARNTVGRASRAVLNSEGLRDAASKKGLGGMAARTALWTSKRGAEGSFDVRASSALGKVPGLGGELGIIGKAGGKGGFDKAVKDKVERKTKYAKDVYGQTAREKELENEFKEKTKAANEASKPEEDRIRRERGDEVKRTREEMDKVKRESETTKISPETQKKMEEAEGEFKTKSTSTLEYAGKKEDIEAARLKMEETKKAHETAINEQNIAAMAKLEEARKVHTAALNKQRAAIEETDYNETVKGLREEAKGAKDAWDPIKNNAKDRRRAYADRLGGGLTGWMAGNKAASRKVREEATGPSKEKKLADAVKAINDETPLSPVTPSGGASSTTPASAPATPSTAPGP